MGGESDIRVEATPIGAWVMANSDSTTPATGPVTAPAAIQPTAGRSIYKEFLERHGEGFQHIALNVSDMDKAVDLFRERGVEVSQDGAWGQGERVDGRFAYLDTDSAGGLTIELLWDRK